MYEELVKRLRIAAILCLEAADAIEELEKFYQIMADAYETEVTKERWIPVTERLPEESWERVLAYTDDGTVMTLPAIKLRNGYVRYWMPIPEPPKEET